MRERRHAPTGQLACQRWGRPKTEQPVHRSFCTEQGGAWVIQWRRALSSDLSASFECAKVQRAMFESAVAHLLGSLPASADDSRRPSSRCAALRRRRYLGQCGDARLAAIRARFSHVAGSERAGSNALSRTRDAPAPPAPLPSDRVWSGTPHCGGATHRGQCRDARFSAT